MPCLYYCMCVLKSLQACLILCHPMDCSPPGSSVHGILQARILEWVAVPPSRGSSWPRDRACISCTAGGFFAADLPGKPIYILTNNEMEGSHLQKPLQDRGLASLPITPQPPLVLSLMVDSGKETHRCWLLNNWMDLISSSCTSLIFTLCLVAQSCPTHCSPMHCSPPGSSVCRTFQARMLEWVSISFSRGSFWPRDLTHISYVSCTGQRDLYH